MQIYQILDTPYLYFIVFPEIWKNGLIDIKENTLVIQSYLSERNYHTPINQITKAFTNLDFLYSYNLPQQFNALSFPELLTQSHPQLRQLGKILLTHEQVFIEFLNSLYSKQHSFSTLINNFEADLPSLIAQEEPYGCSVACTASVLKITYSAAKKLFSNTNPLPTYCQDIVDALEKKGLIYTWHETSKHDPIPPLNTIAFIPPSPTHTTGHYLVKVNSGWMDPWINLTNNPDFNLARSGINSSLPNSASHLIVPYAFTSSF